ncbi:Plasmid stabilization system [Trichormus variabilis ATCC 29413]|uniref:Plasmid stabilization system n=2 Tax=Anabaena variabilis TaxID=264691 RepID=Q3MDK1_TRIV2|nr:MULTISPECIES: type II toxin-antitoxin system YafQ family toxin [Nostocaceae]ABA20935.1 Plasmid stabilization system [Trichormus variabilis ATCC 29413]MBC1214211.1 type II toxin-antitoxin system YafQ family toxin [Trichormus variabilis ARAD]MBC1265610.1 type II toxin-antitoxin system YafQ family toxin [Trichormus variabilis FSR]MBC1301719.1 type II toxin-antitoxin system YafQ family toxin [Trichormus variabilis N2B]MBC1309910.1 type II toxin-antitoxin system YafQ family toxin [Trichormus var
MEVVWSSGFKRSFKKIIKKNPQLKDQIVKVLRLLAEDPFTPSLKSHKLTGDLAGLWSCSVTYNCRIVFTFSEDETLLEMLILLIDIGSHDEVY